MGYFEGRSLHESQDISSKRYQDAAFQNAGGKEYRSLSKGEKIAHLRQQTTARLETGNTFCLLMGKSSPKCQVVLFVTAQIFKYEPIPTLTEAQLKAPFSIVIQAVDIRHDKSEADGSGPFYLDFLPNLSLRQMEQKREEVQPLPKNVIAVHPSDVFTLSGIFTKAQATQLMDHLKARSNVTFYDRLETSTFSSKEVIYPEQLSIKTTSCKVTPNRSSHEEVFDLNIETQTVPNFPVTTSMTTVTIWNGQTIVMSRFINDGAQGKLSRLIFVTVKN